jgi:peptide/nickel transport system ATP-binding protein
MKGILQVKDLKVYFPIRGGIFGRVVGYVKAVDGVSFTVYEGETLGLIGESGSGKSTIGKAILGLVPIAGGSIYFNGEEITKYIGKNRSEYRKSVQMIFQDVHSSLNAKKRVLDVIAEPLRNFEKLTKGEERKRVDELLSIVGMSSLDALKYPHEFSGGQRQRIGVARAIALKPKLIVADEPVSALDLSIQAQVLNYMKDIQEEFNLSFIFISHDLGVVKHMCENLVIMHNSRFVEGGTRDDIYSNPSHIYTRRLIASIPDTDPEKREQNEARRIALNEEYDREYNNYYMEGGGVYDWRPVSGSDTHLVAMPTVDEAEFEAEAAEGGDA